MRASFSAGTGIILVIFGLAFGLGALERGQSKVYEIPAPKVTVVATLADGCVLKHVAYQLAYVEHTSAYVVCPSPPTDKEVQ